MRVFFLCFFLFLIIFSCQRQEGTNEKSGQPAAAVPVNVPVFNADSAYFFLEKQVNFGPRIPNTLAHKKAGDYFIKTLTGFGATVTTQEFEERTFDNQIIRLRNVIGSFFPDRKKRILLAAHWDTRPFADKDKQRPNATFDGANDGASGVAILLEIARVINNSAQQPEIGIDLIFFDGEDWGEPDHERSQPSPGLESWWCLGSQYWAKHKHKPNYSAYYGILLDMVGGKNSQFYRESLSLAYAPSVVEKVWNTAERLGYSDVFVKRNQGEITDDHKYVTEIAKIPMINIVNFDPTTGSFGNFHHTTADNLDLISKETLDAVGTTLLNVIFYEGKIV